MAETTNIEWADATWNPWYGCTKISPGCKFCYMYRDMKIYGKEPSLITRSKTKFEDPLKWQRGVGLKVDEATGEKRVPQFIFTCSWSDFFIEEADEWRAEAWKIIRATPEFTYLVLTKRPWRIHECLPPDWGKAGYPNVWLGVSAENQKYAELRIPYLLREAAAKKFLSLEPLLGRINLRDLKIADPLDISTQLDALTGITYHAGKQNGFFCGGGVDWVIVGGESGSVARPMEIAWPRSLRGQCIDAKVCFFFKQWGEWAPADAVPPTMNLALKTFDSSRALYKVGAEAGGNLLDGRTYLQRPEPIAMEVTA